MEFVITCAITALLSGVSISTRTAGSVNSIVTVMAFTAKKTVLAGMTERVIIRTVLMRIAGIFIFCQIDNGQRHSTVTYKVTRRHIDREI